MPAATSRPSRHGSATRPRRSRFRSTCIGRRSATPLPANSSPRWSSGRAGRAERTNRVLQSACSHESAKKAEVEGAWFLDTEAGQGGITQYGKALGMIAKEKNETRSGAEWGLQNRCSTTELTRQINDLAREHSTNWHRIGTGAF